MVQTLRLRFLAEGEERIVSLAGSRLTLGRGPDNDVVLADVSVSRHHAELRAAGGGWTVHDLGSTNGIEVNRVPVASAPLAPGDRLAVGAFELAVEGELEPPPAAARAPVSVAPSPLANATS